MAGSKQKEVESLSEELVHLRASASSPELQVCGLLANFVCMQ